MVHVRICARAHSSTMLGELSAQFPVDPSPARRARSTTIILVISCSVGNDLGFHHHIDAIFDLQKHLESIKDARMVLKYLKSLV